MPTNEEKLLNACSRGDFEAVTALLKFPDININPVDRFRRTPLGRACSNEHVDVVNALLAHPKIDVNPVDRFGSTLLGRACSNGHVDVVNALLAHPKLNVNPVDRFGNTPLVEACSRRDLDVVNALLADHRVDVNPVARFEDTPFGKACSEGELELVNALLAHPKLNVNPVDRFGRTPLGRACSRRNLDVVNALLADHRVDINEVMDGMSLLYLSYSQGQLDVFNALIKHPNIDVNQPIHKHNRTLLHLACSAGEIRLVRALLTRPKININQADYFRRTPLGDAYSKGHFHVVQVLLGHLNIIKAEVGLFSNVGAQELAMPTNQKNGSSSGVFANVAEQELPLMSYVNAALDECRQENRFRPKTTEHMEKLVEQWFNLSNDSLRADAIAHFLEAEGNTWVRGSFEKKLSCHLYSKKLYSQNAVEGLGLGYKQFEILKGFKLGTVSRESAPLLSKALTAEFCVLAQLEVLERVEESDYEEEIKNATRRKYATTLRSQ